MRETLSDRLGYLYAVGFAKDCLVQEVAVQGQLSRAQAGRFQSPQATLLEVTSAPVEALAQRQDLAPARVSTLAMAVALAPALALAPKMALEPKMALALATALALQPMHGSSQRGARRSRRPCWGQDSPPVMGESPLEHRSFELKP